MTSERTSKDPAGAWGGSAKVPTLHPFAALQRQQFLYTACYCEENIWQMCQHTAVIDAIEAVLLISNENLYCALWRQKAGSGDDGFILWDYHVVALARSNTLQTVENPQGWVVLDLDTQLPFPCAANVYFAETFRGRSPRFATVQPTFRWMPRQWYVENLCSDRKHMLKGNQYTMPPPSWPPPNFLQHTNGSWPKSNLFDLIDMKKKFAQTTIFDLSSLSAHLGIMR